MSHKVTAAYVTLRVRNEVGQEVLRGFYEGALVPESANQDDLDRHVRKGLVAEVGTPEAEMASPVGTPVDFDDAGMPVAPQPAEVTRPPQNAPKADWVAYAVTQRADDVSEEDAQAEAEAMSKADLIAKYGG